MADIKINAPELTPPATDVVEQAPPEVVQVPEDNSPIRPADRIPAYWHIQPNGPDQVYAVNGQTGRHFVGTPKEMSKFWKVE